MLIYGHDAEVAEWVRQRVPNVQARGFSECVAIGVPSRDMTRIIAGAVFNDYYPEFGTMQLSMAADSPMWARREVIRELLAYPFLQCQVWKLWTSTEICNKRALDVNSHIGFKREAVLAHHFGKNRHCVISRMTKPVFDRLYG